MRFRIPKQFQQYGSTVRVMRKGTEHFHSNCVYGDYDYDHMILCLRDDIPKEVEMQTFWHEFLHCAFNAAGYTRECADERMVDTIAGLIAQMIKSAE